MTNTLKRGIIFLDGSGDTVVTWDPEKDVSALTYIRKKMEEGYSFFLTDPPKTNGLPQVLTSVAQAPSSRLLLMDDADAKVLLEDGIFKLGKIEPVKEIKTARRAKKAEEVVGTPAVAVRPRSGG